MVVGNLFVGTTYVEPQGLSQMTCEATGTTCSMDYKVRSNWIARPEHENFVTAIVKDADGKECYKI